MKSVPLKAYPRTQSRRGGVKKLRAAGRVPAIIYGRQAKPQNLEVNAKEFGDLIHHSASENLLVDLSVENDARAKRLALVQEIQHHPLDGKVLHVDFHEVAENEKVIVQVPLETVGEAAGVKNSGGVLEHVLFKLKVRCLPKDLPEQIVVDVSHLELGKAVHLGEIKAPAGVEILGDKNIPVVSVALPRTEEEEAAATTTEAVAAGDVEMIKEKKEEGEEGAAPAKGEKGAAKPGEKAPAKGAEKGAASAGGKGRRQGRREKAGGEKAGGEKEIILRVVREDRRARAAHGAIASHRGPGQSGRGIREDAPQCRVFAGRKTGRALEGGLEERTKVQRPRGPRRTRRTAAFCCASRRRS